MIRSSSTTTAKVILRGTINAQRWTRRQHRRSKSSIGSVRHRSRSPSLSSKSARVVSDHNKMTNTIDVSKNERQRRKQHQLVASSAPMIHDNHAEKAYLTDSTPEDEEERLAAMRLFLDSLQLATANSTLFNTTALNSLTSEMMEESDNEVQESLTRLQCDETIDGNADEATELERQDAHSQSTTTTTTRQNKPNTTADRKKTDFDRLNSTLRRSVHRKHLKRSLNLFRESQRNKQILPRATVTDLFFMVSETDPVSAYSILQYYNLHFSHQEQPSSSGKSGGGIVDLDSRTHKRRSLYKRIVNSIRLLDPQRDNTRQMHVLVDSLLNEIEAMDDDTKRVLYPKLVVSLVSQRIVTIGPYAHGIYDSFVDRHGSDIKTGWLNRLLSMSRYNRQDDLPFHDVMTRLVRIPGGQLNPESVLPAIQNMFPFTDTEAVCVALRAWLEDFRNKQPEYNDENSEYRHDNELLQLNPEDLIDLSTLESVSIGASQGGSSELILLVWDVLETCCYPPTETIYENTVMAFANEKGSLEQAFAAIASMKEDGFEISRPLLRSVSSAIRLNRSLIGRARRMLIEDHENEMAKLENQRLLSLETINVVLSSYAERGDPKDTVEILDVMTENDIEPNADSYSFVIEALGRDIKRRLKTNDQDYIQRNISIANTVLSMMEGKGMAPNTHVIRNYVELLCLGGEIETATSIVEDYLSSTESSVRNTVNNITIYRVASEHVTLGNCERAKALAEKMTERVPALHRRIKSKEQREQYIQETMEDSLQLSESEELAAK